MTAVLVPNSTVFSAPLSDGCLCVYYCLLYNLSPEVSPIANGAVMNAPQTEFVGQVPATRHEFQLTAVEPSLLIGWPMQFAIGSRFHVCEFGCANLSLVWPKKLARNKN